MDRDYETDGPLINLDTVSPLPVITHKKRNSHIFNLDTVSTRIAPSPTRLLFNSDTVSSPIVPSPTRLLFNLDMVSSPIVPSSEYLTITTRIFNNKSIGNIVTNYTLIPETTRLNKAYEAFNREIYSFYANGNTDFILNAEILNKFFKKLTDYKLSEQECVLLKDMIIINYVNKLKNADNKHKYIVMLFFDALISYVDLLFDILVMIKYTQIKVVIAVYQLCALILSFVLQCVFSIYIKQPWWMNVFSFIGMKTFIEAFRYEIDILPFYKQLISNDYVLWAARTIDILSRTLPQIMIQMYAFFIIENEQRGAIHYVSIILSLISCGSSIAYTDRIVDMDEYRRESDPTMFGYVPPVLCESNKQYAALSIFYTCYLISKAYTFTILALSSPSVMYPLMFMLTECAIMFAIRFYYNNWRFYRKDADGVIFSIAVHCFIYMCMFAAPFPTIRNPSLLMPRIYACYVIYMLLVNFPILVWSYYTFDAYTHCEISFLYSLLVLCGSTLFSFIFGALSFYYVPIDIKPSFYKCQTMHQYISDWWWDNVKVDYIENGVYINDLNNMRANLPNWCSLCYLPLDKLKKLYAEKSDIWENNDMQWYADVVDRMSEDEEVFVSDF